MSVLYKALQKAAKENEQRQPVAPGASFDAERLAGSGVIRSGSSRAKWRIASLAFLLVAMLAMGAAYYFTTLVPDTAPQVAVAPRRLPPAPPAPSAPVTPETQAAAGAPAQATGLTPSAPPVGAPVVPAQAVVQPAAGVPAPPVVAAAPVSMPATVAPAPPVAQNAVKSEPAALAPQPPSEPAVASLAPTPKAPARPVAAPKAPAGREPMPSLATDSPARMLDPPISVRRSQIDLEGVGNAVRVRNVSQAAQDTVGSAYNALIRGEYDTALGFYSQALKQEPRSVLALLGRGTALQKLGRKEEARASYEQALKVDPSNREALSNLTSLEAERAPGDALTRLLGLERDYPGFSPLKAQIGMVYARMDNFEGAQDYLRRALAITPEAALYQYNLALVLDRMGRAEQAVEVYDTVLASMSAGRAIPELSAADIQRRANFLRAR